MKLNYKVLCLTIISLEVLCFSPLMTHAEEKLNSDAGVGFYGEYKPSPNPGKSGKTSKSEIVLNPGQETKSAHTGVLPRTGDTTHSWLPVIGDIILASTIIFFYWYKNRNNKKWSV